MNLINYMLRLSESGSNIILSNLSVGLGITHWLAKWSVENPDYIYVCRSNKIVDKLNMDLIDNKGNAKCIMTQHKYNRLLNKTDVDVDLIEYIRTGKVILYDINNIYLLRNNNFKFCISHLSNTSFLETHYGYLKKSYYTKGTGKELIDCKSHIKDYVKTYKRERNLKSLFDE